MLVVRVELWSAITGKKSEIARMVIHNKGGTKHRGDYGVVTFRGRDGGALHIAMINWLTKKTDAQREGEVLGHQRLSKHVWNLVTKALLAVKYDVD